MHAERPIPAPTGLAGVCRQVRIDDENALREGPTVSESPTRRRAVLGSICTVIAGAVAGCSTSTGGEAGGPRLPGPSTEGGTATTTREKSWMANVENYRGYADHQEESRATIEVGVVGDDGGHWFDPAGLLVSPDTTVVWEWTGNGEHGVVDRDGAFESRVTDDPSYTFEFTVEGPEIYRYYCPNHRDEGMKGAVLVQ